MVSITVFRKLALSFPEATEESHFEKTSFRVKKKIFATYDAKLERASLKLPLTDQDIFSLTAKNIIYPVPNKWGQQGWTFVEMSTVKPELFAEALRSAYLAVAPGKLGEQIKGLPEE